MLWFLFYVIEVSQCSTILAHPKQFAPGSLSFLGFVSYKATYIVTQGYCQGIDLKQPIFLFLLSTVSAVSAAKNNMTKVSLKNCPLYKTAKIFVLIKGQIISFPLNLPKYLLQAMLSEHFP